MLLAEMTAYSSTSVILTTFMGYYVARRRKTAWLIYIHINAPHHVNDRALISCRKHGCAPACLYTKYCITKPCFGVSLFSQYRVLLFNQPSLPLLCVCMCKKWQNESCVCRTRWREMKSRTASEKKREREMRERARGRDVLDSIDLLSSLYH